jgi:hypothetical protein
MHPYLASVTLEHALPIVVCDTTLAGDNPVLLTSNVLQFGRGIDPGPGHKYLNLQSVSIRLNHQDMSIHVTLQTLQRCGTCYVPRAGVMAIGVMIGSGQGIL